MDSWRSFFSKAGEDLWTIIEQAILLAALDHPKEFREKRCNIAEILFATRCRAEDMDATRPAASVITNCAIQTKLQAVDTTAKDGVDASACISTVVCDIKDALADSMQPDGTILCGLQKLESLHVTVDVLKETEIGKQVNNLRKHSCKEIRLLAKSLVRHWKELVDNWVNCAGTSVDLRGGQSALDNVEETRVLSACDEDTNFLTEVPGEKQHGKGRDRSLEAPEERGRSSRAELAGLCMVGRPERPCCNASSIASMDLSQDESNTGTDELTGWKTSNRNASVLHGNHGVGKLSSEDSNNASKLEGDYCSQRQKMKRQYLSYDDEGVGFEVKMGATTDSKRKWQDGCFQTENVNGRKRSILLT